MPASVADIKANIQYLHQQLLGETLALTDPELDRTYQVFLGTWQELQTAGQPDLIWECQAQNDPIVTKPMSCELGNVSPVVIVPGYALNGHSWEKQETALLAAGNRVIT